ncbi:MAG: hypothetical protein JXP73_21320 [Deltaproteobacteria bacterium]|nr:hypothetical protein [Deltaproteobacteria bacterium]
MKNAAFPFLASLLALLLPACSDGNGGSGNIDNTKEPDCTEGTNLMASASHNYAFQSAMTLPVIKVKPRAELTLDWGSVTTDIIGHNLDTKNDLNMVMVIPFSLSPTELAEKLNADTLEANDIVISPPLTLRTDGNNTTAKLFSFDLNGTAVTPEQITEYFDPDFYPPENHTYALAVASGTEVGQGIRKIQAFQLDPGSSNTDVKATNDSVKLTWSANLRDLTPTGLPAGEAAVTLDWGDMTTNAMNRDFDPTQITRAFIGRYDEGSGQLEKSMIDYVELSASGVQLVAPELYMKDIEIGTSVDLSTMKTKSGDKAFAGINESGTWLVALTCGVCRNPAPWYLSILKVCP